MARIDTSVVFYTFLLHIFLSFVISQSAPETALVTQLPGFNGTFPSKHYAGYVTIDESHGKNLYYYFVVSESKPSQDPVVIWLNGGPGCSSLDGFVYEHGPFNFIAAENKSDIPKLQLNPYSWSKASNIIYLDSPAGVGFSYSQNNSDYITGDFKTATDTHAFLLKWFQLYPEFLSNPLFLSGESFAGVYVPTLAYEIMKGIDSGVKPLLNLKGYLIGNAVTDENFDGNALIPFVHGMGLISDDLYEVVAKECNGTYYGNSGSTDTCDENLSKVDKAISELNIYNILEPCYHVDSGPNKTKTSDDRLPASFRMLGQTERPLPVRKRMFGRSWPLWAPVRDGTVPTWPQLSSNPNVPCTSDEVASAWLNNAEVRKAIHATEVKLITTWELCTDRIQYNHDAGSMIKYHRNLTSRGYRALIYSGDHDMCVPFTGSEAWTRSMGYRIVDEWRPWISNEQVAGFTQGYEHNLTFATVKGSGHTVPEYKPQEALELFQRFLTGKPI